MKQIIILVFLTISVVGYSNSVTTPNYEEATNYAYAGLGCLIGASVLYGVATIGNSIFSCTMMSFYTVAFTITYMLALVTEKFISGPLSIYAGTLISQEDYLNCLLFYCMSWVSTLFLTLPGSILTIFEGVQKFIGIGLYVLGTLLSIGLQAGAVSIPIYVLKL